MARLVITMGRIFLSSWIASARLSRNLTAVLLLCGLHSTAYPASFSGVVYSNHSGPSSDASGILDLWVQDKLYTLYYGEPFPRDFKSNTCRDIGAIWSVEVRTLPDGTLYVDRAKCTGAVYEVVHKPWQLVTEYLKTVGQNPELSRSLLSQPWRSSVEFRKYTEAIRDLRVSDYERFGHGGTCIDVVRVEGPDRVELSAGVDCYIFIKRKPVDLLFTIARSTSTRSWEIDRVQIVADSVVEKMLKDRR